MSNVKFIIDKSREDSFYHYAKTDSSGSILIKNNGKPAIGWGLYSQLKSEEEQSAWVEAVNEFNVKIGIKTPCSVIKNNLQDFKNSITLDDTKFPDKQSYLLPALGAAVKLVSNPETVLCDETFLEQLLSACGGVIPTKENIAKYALESAKTNLEIDCHILLNNLTKLGINGFVTSIVDITNSIIEKYFNLTNAVYNEYTRLASDVIRLYRKSQDGFGLSDTKREQYKSDFLNKLSTFGQNHGQQSIQIVINILCIDTISQLSEMLKSVKTLSADVWKSMIIKFKDIIQLYKDIDTEFAGKKELISLLNSLLFAVAALLGAVLVMNCLHEKEIDNAVQAICDVEGVNNSDELHDKIHKETEEHNNNLREYTVIYKKAVDRKEGYSLDKSSTNNIIAEDDLSTQNNTSNSSVNCLCKVSMCENIDDTDTSEWFNNFEYPEYVIVEVDLRKKCKWNIKSGDHISLNNIIGEIEDTPIKSIFSCDILEVHPNYFIAQYSDDSNILSDDILSFTDNDMTNISTNVQSLLNDKVESSTGNQYTKIIDKCQKYQYACDFIKDYASFCKFPELAEYTREHANADSLAISIDNFIEKYEDTAQEIIDIYNNDVQKICKKKTVESYARQGNLVEFKEILDDKKDTCLKNIITLYDNNPGEMKYCSKGRLCDFYLYSHYIEYLNSDKFEYDEDNPYIAKLFNKINEFVGIRTRLELNEDNLDSLMLSFNEMCEKTIKLYWPFTDIDYYSKLSELFKFDTYTNTEIISEGTQNDSISLYKRLLNYLKSITKFTKTDNYNTDSNDDILNDIQGYLQKQEQLESAPSNKENTKFEKQLKKIAYRFAALRKIELSLNNTNITTYADNKIIEDFEKLKISKGETVNEYTENTKYTYKDKLYQTESIIGPYFEVFKKMASSEAEEIKSIYNDAVQYYLSNKDSINSCEELFNLREINWPTQGTIYKDNNPRHYYLFNADTSIPPKSLKDLKMYENAAKIPEEYNEDSLYDMMSAPNTAYGADNIIYWLRYCCVATLVNTIVPVYWATGLNIGSPVPLPIIYLPFIPICTAGVITVIGLGICGIAIWPMMLFVNTGATKASIIIPINLAVDQIQKLVEKIKSQQNPMLQGIVNPLVKTLDNEINQCINDEHDIEYQISELQKVSIDYNTKYCADTIIGKDTNSKANPLNEKLIAGTYKVDSTNIDELLNDLISRQKSLI